MVYVYLAASSLLLFLFGNAAVIRRDENDGAVWLVLLLLSGLVTLLRIANLLSKAVYKACSGEHKKVTVSDLMVFDGVLFVLYGILAGLGHDFSDLRGWWYLAVIGVPGFAWAVWSVVRRFRAAYILHKMRHDPNYDKVFINN